MTNFRISRIFCFVLFLILMNIDLTICMAAQNFTQSQSLNFGTLNGLYVSGSEVWICTEGGLRYNNNSDLTPATFVYKGLYGNSIGYPKCFVKGGNNRWIAGMSNYGIYYSDNQGGSWTFVNIQNNWETTCIAVIGGSGSNTVILAGTRVGLFKSADNGDTWSLVSSPFFQSVDFRSIAVSGSNIFITAHPNYIYFSNDLGVTWSLKNTGINSQNYIVSLTFSLDGSTLFAGTAELTTSHLPARTYRSMNLGNTWSNVSPSPTPYGPIYALTHSSLSSIIAAGYWGFGILVTPDYGVSWYPENTNLGNYDVRSLAVTSTINRFYASTLGGVYYSDNLGDNSSTSLNWIPANGSYHPIGLPLAFNNTWVATARQSGFNVSLDNGSTWVTRNSGLDSMSVINSHFNNNTYFVSSGSGVYRSSNTGASWQLTTLTDTSIINFTSSGNSVYAVSRNNGFYRSSNAGFSWTSSNTGMTNLKLRDVTMHAGQLFVCGNGGIYRSSNTGFTWVYSGGDTSSFSLASDNNILYCAGSRLYFTSDYGGSWGSNAYRSPSCFLENNDVVNNLAAKDGKVYLASTSADSGLFVSSNYGASWNNIYDGWGSRRFTSAAINSDTIYLGDRYGGITTLALNSTFTLNLRCLIEGLYPGSGEAMDPDTVRVNIRSATSPYPIVESSKLLLSGTGTGAFNFSNVSNGMNYYIEVVNRNSISTWSKTGGAVFTGGTLNYDFTTSASQAYGNNQVLKGSKYCIYSGDVNQDGAVDVIDIGIIDNDASNFVTGYVNSDLTGDNVTDVADLAIADNNSYNFITKQTPP